MPLSGVGGGGLSGVGGGGLSGVGGGGGGVPGGGEGSALAPGDVGGQDQGGDLASAGRGQRAHRVLGQVTGGAAGVHPARYGPGQRLDVGLQGRVVADVTGGVSPDDVQHRAARPTGVVQVGQAVGQAR